MNPQTEMLPKFLKFLCAVALTVWSASACTHSPAGSEPILVVQREAGKIAVIENDQVAGEIAGLGDMSHATVKFHAGKAWVISRDGNLSRVDVAGRRVERTAKVGESGIGFTFLRDHVVVANYSPSRVVVLNLNLDIVKVIETGSRNVGIKSWKDRAAFALMDKDEVWVIDAARGFEVVKKITAAGAMPFDALILDQQYVVGFFNENKLGFLNLETLAWDTRSLGAEGREVVMKVPHFGTWGVAGDVAFVPGVKERRLHVFEMNPMRPVGSVTLPGLPVFAVVSPDQKLIAVNYSGDMEDMVTLVDAGERKVLGTWPAGKRVMHLRFSGTGDRLFVSSYFENKFKSVQHRSWNVAREVPVPGPSGIFHEQSGR